MSDAQHRIERKLAESGQPLDPTQEEPSAAETSTERIRRFDTTGFSRMRTDWDDADRESMGVILAETDLIIRSEFRVAFAVMARLRKLVRIPAADPESGEVLTGPDDRPLWETDEDDLPVENWGLLRDADRASLLFSIASFLFEWELAAVDKWAEAMFAKVQWEDRFSHSFTALPGVSITGKPTIEDRTQWGQRLSLEERYFAIFKSALSRKADALIRSMIRIQRLLEGTSTR